MGTGNVPKSVTVYLESIPVLCRQQCLGRPWDSLVGNSGCRSACPAVPAMVLCFCTTLEVPIPGDAACSCWL